jgi:hypothetical protein
MRKTPDLEEARAIAGEEDEEGNVPEAPELPRPEPGMKQKIVDSLTKFDPTLAMYNDRESDRTTLTNTVSGTPAPVSLQIHVFQDRANITIPYWYTGKKAEKVFAMASSYLRVIGTVAGHFAYDPQMGRAFDPVKEDLGSSELYQKYVRAF